NMLSFSKEATQMNLHSVLKREVPRDRSRTSHTRLRAAVLIRYARSVRLILRRSDHARGTAAVGVRPGAYLPAVCLLAPALNHICGVESILFTFPPLNILLPSPILKLYDFTYTSD